MKKFTILSLALMSFFGLAVAQNVDGNVPASVNRSQRAMEKEAAIKEKAKAMMEKMESEPATRAPQQTLTPIIYNPEGDYVYYLKLVSGYDNSVMPFTEDDFVTVVFGENNEVYFQDIISFYFYRSFVKGTLEDGKITMQLPQTVNYYADYGFFMNLTLFEKNPSPTSSEDLYVVSDINQVEFTYNQANGDMALNLPGNPGDYALGYTFAIGEGVYLEECNYTQTYEVYNGYDSNIRYMPQGVPTKTYQYREIAGETDYAYEIQVAETEEVINGKTYNYIYIKGLSENFPQGVVRVRISDDDPNIGLLSANYVLGSCYGLPAYTKVCDYASYELFMETGNPFYLVYPSGVYYQLQIDRENNEISQIYGYMDQYLYCIIAVDGVSQLLNFFEPFDAFTITVPNYEGTPMDPQGISVLDFGDSYQVGFIIPTVSTDNNSLNVNDLYYTIYVNDEPWEFEPEGEHYVGLTGPTYEIPFDVNNNYDIFAYDYTMRFVTIDVTGADKIGVQSVYKYGGVTTKSQIISTTEFVDYDDSGIESVGSDVVVSETYYDLNGRKVENPAKGVFILKKTMADGSVKSEKVLKR